MASPDPLLADLASRLMRNKISRSRLLREQLASMETKRPQAKSDLDAARQAEFDKYEWAYSEPGYCMGAGRRNIWRTYLEYLKGTGAGCASVCDVGTGRGEALDDAVAAGFAEVAGYEVLDSLCNGRVRKIGGIHSLPADNDSYDLVSCQDVLEHLIEGDVRVGLSELIRIARKRVYLKLAWYSHTMRDPDGNRVEMHVTRRTAKWWLCRVKEAIPADATATIVAQSVTYSNAVIEVVL